MCACVCIILFLLLYALIFWRKSRAIALSIWPLVFLSPRYRSSGNSRPLTKTISRSIGIHAESRQCRDLKMWIYWNQVFFLYNVTGGGQRLKLGWVLSEPPHHCAAFRGPVLDCSALNLHISWGFNSTGQKRTNLGVADKESVEAGSSTNAGPVWTVVWKVVHIFFSFSTFAAEWTSQGEKKYIPELKSLRGLHILNISPDSWSF